MLRQIEGSHAIAEAVALCRPEVISCYPITPQTHIVEDLSSIVREGRLGNCQYITVESEFSALSNLIGASATGVRTYTATSSQGLLFMAEALFNASGLGLPIVMTIGNRAIGAPINIWNDHSDSMSMRDSGWLQLYVENNQEAVDCHIQAFKLAEELSCPVMVCMDGFILTHAYERVDLPDQAIVDSYLPKFQPKQILDPAEPASIGAMVGPEAFTEVRYLMHHKQLQALDLIPLLSQEFKEKFGRESGGLLQPYRMDDAETVVVALGSVNGTIKDVVDGMRNDNQKIGSLKIVSFRPFPLNETRKLLSNAKRVIVVEKYLAPGKGGVLSSNIRMALRGLNVPVHTLIAGLGGRPILFDSLANAFMEIAANPDIEEPLMLDMKMDIIQRELERQKTKRLSGATAENILRDVNAKFSTTI